MWGTFVFMMYAEIRCIYGRIWRIVSSPYALYISVYQAMYDGMSSVQEIYWSICYLAMCDSIMETYIVFSECTNEFITVRQIFYRVLLLTHRIKTKEQHLSVCFDERLWVSSARALML